MRKEFEEPQIFKNLELYNALANIISSNKIYKSDNQLLYFSKKNSIMYVESFLANNSIVECNKFCELLRKHKIDFVSRNGSGFYKPDRIKINYTRTLDDAFSLVHEFSHYNLYMKEQTPIYNLFNETLSKESELQLDNYLNHTNISSESTNIIKKVLNEDSEIPNIAKFELELYREYIKNKKIDLDEIDIELYNYYVNRPYKASIDKVGKYLFSNVVSLYINELIQSSRLTMNEYIKLKNELILFETKDISKVLDLDINYDEKEGLNISDSSIDKLSKTYSLGIKRYNER